MMLVAYKCSPILSLVLTDSLSRHYSSVKVDPSWSQMFSNIFDIYDSTSICLWWKSCHRRWEGANSDASASGCCVLLHYVPLTAVFLLPHFHLYSYSLPFSSLLNTTRQDSQLRMLIDLHDCFSHEIMQFVWLLLRQILDLTHRLGPQIKAQPLKPHFDQTNTSGSAVKTRTASTDDHFQTTVCQKDSRIV